MNEYQIHEHVVNLMMLGIAVNVCNSFDAMDILDAKAALFKQINK